MTTTNRSFDARNGISVANTVIVSNASGVLNVSNITMMNVNGTGSILNVSGNIANAGNLLVTQNSFTGNLSVSQNASFGNITVTLASAFGSVNASSLNVSGNISNTGNLLVTQNSFTGNLVVTQNATFGNISAANVSITGTGANLTSLNVSANISNTGNLLVTQNSFTGNLSVTQNASFGNITTANLAVTGTGANLTSLNVSANISNTGNLLVTQNTFTGNINVSSNIGTGNIIQTTVAPIHYINDTTLANANNQNWGWKTGANNLSLQTFDNLGLAGNTNQVIAFTRGAPHGLNIATINIGSVTDLPNVIVFGNVVLGNANTSQANIVMYGSGQINIGTSYAGEPGGILNVSGNIANTGNLLVTQNTFTGNLSVTQNLTAGNISVTNVSMTGQGNLSAGNGTFSGGVTIAGNLLVNGTTVTLNSSIIQTNDQFILLTANNQSGDTLDYGFAGLAKNVTIGNAWSGLIKHHTDEIWYLFDGYAQTATLTLNTASLNIAQTNVATINANVFAQYINVATLNVATILNPIAQFANGGVYVAGTLVANNPNINFVSANTSNLSIIGTSNVSPGNVTITFDTRVPPGVGGGGSVNAYANSGLIAASLDNIVWLNSASILYVVTQNASETKAVNVQPSVNTTLNLVSLNVSANISNVGNLLITQNTFTGNISIATLANVTTLNVSANIANTGNLLVSQNTFTGNLTVLQNTTAGNIVFANANTSGTVNVTGNLTVNTFVFSVSSTTLATASQSVLDNFSPTGIAGGFATVEYTVQANCANSFHATKLMIVTDGTNVYMDEYGTVLSDGPVGTLTAALTAGNGQLLWTSNNATSTVIRSVRYAIQA